MATKMLAATQNSNTNKQNQLKITKETLNSNVCRSCVRLLVHRFTFSMLYENIRIKNDVDEIFFQILFVWQENDFVFSSEFEKSIKSNKKKNSHLPPPPPPPPPTHILKFSMLMCSINGSQGKGTHIFYKTMKLVLL